MMLSQRFVGAIVLGLLAAACGDVASDPQSAPKEPVAQAEAEPASEATPPEPDPRSVLLITIDTLRADALGVYGSERKATPWIDSVANEGVIFEQSSAATPITLPSHASIMTGLNPYHHGARANGRYRLADEHVTLAERLQEIGLVTAAETATSMLTRSTGIDQGFDHHRDVDSRDAETDVAPISDAEPNLTRDAKQITRRGIEFVREHRRDPFFLWLHYYDPHAPYKPPREYARRHEENLYYGEVAHVDREVGRLISALSAAGLRKRTLVVITADHGEGLGDHGEDTHAGFVYESTMRVPLVFWGPPELAGGSRVATPVRAVDIAPTVLDWLGLAPLERTDGRSLLPLLRGEEDPASRLVYGESIDLKIRFGTSILRTVREGPWKYIHKVRPALYHLTEDPGETRNRIEEEPERAQALPARLETLLRDARRAPDTAVERVDERTAGQLEALGYVAGGSTPRLANEPETLELSGTDPDDLADDVREYLKAFTLLRDGKSERALAILDPLAERNPRSSQVLEGRIDAHLQLQNADELLALLRLGIEIDPEYRRYWHNLFEVELQTGRTSEARETLRRYHEGWPCDTDARLVWAGLAGREGDHAGRFEILEQGIEACGSPPELRNDLAYALATIEDPEWRDAERAVGIAEEVVAELEDNPAVLDTLGVAYAAAGRTEEAQATLERALSLARIQRASRALRNVLKEHLELVEQGEPIVE